MTAQKDFEPHIGKNRTCMNVYLSDPIVRSLIDLPCLYAVKDNFDIVQPSYEMMFVAYSKNRKWFPYPDKTARLQVVDNTNNKWLSEVLKITTENGHPILINTSLNAKGKPIVNTHEDFTKEVNYEKYI